MTTAVAIVELIVDLATGAISLRGPHPIAWMVSVIRPVLAYGATVAAIRRLTRGSRADLLTAPMPLGLAVVLAPLAAAVAALPQALWLPELTGVSTTRDILLSLTDFMVGDLLGALVLTPPLLWAADFFRTRKLPPMPRFRPPALVEASLLLVLALLITALFLRFGLGLQPMPALLAVVWIGLRFGRVAAWTAVLVMIALVLSQTAGGMPAPARLEMHLSLATSVVAGYLAGSLRDALAKARSDLARRDRLLFQAERLKTVRAMSVAVIHEISQPLSTIAIEARHLRALSEAEGWQVPSEIAEAAALVDRKVSSLSDLVRRLRRFGGRAADEPSPLPLSALLATIGSLTAAEAKAAGVTVAVTPCDPDMVVLAQEVELAQAVVNLVRNAISASAGGAVHVACSHASGQFIRLLVTNRIAQDGPAGGGMGVGLLIARVIVEAHGGRIESTRTEDSFTQAILLPPYRNA